MDWRSRCPPLLTHQHLFHQQQPAASLCLQQTRQQGCPSCHCRHSWDFPARTRWTWSWKIAAEDGNLQGHIPSLTSPGCVRQGHTGKASTPHKTTKSHWNHQQRNHRPDVNARAQINLPACRRCDRTQRYCSCEEWVCTAFVRHGFTPNRLFKDNQPTNHTMTPLQTGPCHAYLH